MEQFDQMQIQTGRAAGQPVKDASQANPNKYCVRPIVCMALASLNVLHTEIRQVSSGV